MRFGIGLAACLVVSGTSMSGDTKNSAAEEMKTAHASDGYAKLTIHYPATFFLISQKPIKVVVENVGKKVLWYDDQNIYQSFDIAVFDDKGKAVPRTRYGMSLPPNLDIFSGNSRRLQPGATIEMDFELLRAFDMTIPQSYKLNATVASGFMTYVTNDKVIYELSVKDIPINVEVRSRKISK